MSSKQKRLKGLAWLPQDEDDQDEIDINDQNEPPYNYVYPEPPTPSEGPYGNVAYDIGPIVEARSDEEISSSEEEDEEAAEDERILEALLADQDNPYLDPDFFDGGDAEDSDFNDSEQVAQEGLQAMSNSPRKRGRPRGSQNTGREPKRQRRKLSGTTPTSPRKSPDGRRSRKKTRTRKAIEPSEDIKLLLSKATAAHLRRDTEETIDHCLDIIHKNPEIWAAHSLYSEALESQGKLEDSLRVLENGSAYIKDSALLWDIVLRFQQLVTDLTPDRDDRLNSLLTQVISATPTHLEARRLRMQMADKQRHYGRAIKEGLVILAERPWDTETLREVCAIAAKDSAINNDALPEAFETTIEHYHEAEAQGGKNEFDFNMLNIYMELLFRMKQFEVGVRRLRTVSRWLLGRESEQFWDRYDDDREWDIEDSPRRTAVPEFKKSRFDAGSYGSGLPLELRVRLGLFRLNLEQDNEAERHLARLYIDENQARANAAIFADLFCEVGDNLRRLGRHEEAVKYYVPMEGVAEVDHIGLYENMAYCYKAMGAYSKAAATLEKYLDGGPNAAVARLQLAEMYEHLGNIEKATEHATWVKGVKQHWLRKEPVLQRLLREEVSIRPPRQSRPSPRKQFVSAGDPNEDADEAQEGPRLSGLLDPLPPLRSFPRTRVSAADLDESEIPVYLSNAISMQLHNAYDKLLPLQDTVDADDEGAMQEWQTIAPLMIDHFASVQMFYRTRQRGVKWIGFERGSSRTDYSDEAIDRYHDISFDDWLSVFCRTALVQAKLAVKARPGQVAQRHVDESDEENDNNDNGDDDRGSVEAIKGVERSSSYRKRKRDAYHAPQPTDDSSQVLACWVTLANADNAQPFNSETRRLERIRLVSLVCGLILDDEQRVCEDTRMLIKSLPYYAEPLKLYNTLSRLYSSGRRVWHNAGPHQKYFLRTVKQTDFAVLDEPDRKLFKFSDTERRSWTSAGSGSGGSGNPQKLEGLSAPLMALHAHMLHVGGATPSALYYYYRLCALLPDDPVLWLAMANCYVELAQRRLSDNRLYWIQHALAFFNRYFEVRVASERAVHRQEAHFNRGRFWYALGLQHLCVRHFERAMEMGEEVRREEMAGEGEVENFAPDAAFALSTVLSLSGDARGARRVRERYLVLS